jgi:RecA/RadA recombinase
MAANLKVIDTGMATATNDRQKALDAALAQIDRAFGKGSAMRLGSKETMQVEVISTGSLGLDIALGVGGLPRGRVIEIYGPESSGKTTLALHVIAEAQKNGGTAAFVDAEHALDPVYARKLGVNIDELIVSQPDTTTGGNALKFYASVRLDIRRIGAVKAGEEVTGNQTRVKVVKNKVAPPFKQVEFDIMYGQGVSKLGEILDLGVKAGLVEKSGAWFSYDSVRLGQGRENSKTFLKDNPETADRLEKQIRARTDKVAEEMMVGPGAEDDA